MIIDYNFQVELISWYGCFILQMEMDIPEGNPGSFQNENEINHPVWDARNEAMN